MGKRIGLFGGTFDPVHIGHLRGALEVAEQFGSKPVRNRSRTRWINQAMIGNGSNVTSASHGLIETRMMAVIVIMITSVAKSSKCRERKRRESYQKSDG